MWTTVGCRYIGVMPKSRHVPARGLDTGESADDVDVTTTDTDTDTEIATDTDTTTGIQAATRGDEGPEAGDAMGGATTAVTPLDGAAFLEANRTNREKYRAEAEKKAAKRESKDEASARDRVPRKLAGSGSRTSRFTVAGSRKVFVAICALVVLVIALAASTAILAVAYRDANSRPTASTSGLDPTSQAAIDAARKYAVELTTYDSTNFGDLDRRIEAISTPAFTQSYVQASQDARRRSAAVNAVSSAKVGNAGLMSVHDGKYVVLLALDQTLTSPQIQKDVPEGIFYQSRVKMTVERAADGGWLISDLVVV